MSQPKAALGFTAGELSRELRREKPDTPVEVVVVDELHGTETAHRIIRARCISDRDGWVIQLFLADMQYQR